MFNPHSLNEQLNKHIEDPQRYTNVWPNSNWDLAQYKQFFEYVDQGWLIQGDRWDLGCNAFIINPDWEDEAPYEVEEKKKFKFKVVKKKKEENFIAWTEDFVRDTCYFCKKDNDGWGEDEDAVCDCCRKKWRYDEDRDGYVRINKK